MNRSRPMQLLRTLVVPLMAALMTPLLGSPARAELRFAHPQVEAGEVRSGAPLSQRFDFVNDGPAPAVITEVRASCGCLSPRLEPAGTALPHSCAPGEQGALVLEVNTLSQGPGVHVWTLAVRYETGGQVHEAEVRLSARVVTEVAVRPAELTIFADAAVVHEIVVTDLRPQPLHVTEVRSTSPRITGRVTEPSRDMAGHAVHKVRLEVAGDFPEGRHQETVDLFTDDPTYRDLRVQLTVVKRGRRRLTATPNPVELLVEPGQGASQLILVRDSDGQPVVIDRAEADDPAVTCRWAPGPTRVAAVRVRGSGRVRTTVRIHVGKPVEETLAVPVTCTPR
jgi:hypothetical protein